MGRNTPMKIKPDSRQEKGWTDLTDSLYSLRKDIFHMIEKRIGPIFNVFCVGSPLHVKFAMSTLPFCLEHSQIDPDLYEKMKDALTPGPGHMAKPFPGNPEFSVDSSILKSMKEKILKDSSSPVSIYYLMNNYAAEGSIDNLTWPEWVIPAKIEEKGGKFDYKVKKDTFSYLGMSLEMYLDWMLKIKWIREIEMTLSHNDGIKDHKAKVPGYELTDAGKVIYGFVQELPTTLPCLKENALYPGVGYLNYRRFVVLQALTKGCLTPEAIGKYAEGFGVNEREQIIDDVIEDLVRGGLNIETAREPGKDRNYIPHKVDLMTDAPLGEMRVEKPEHFIEKDLKREEFLMIGRRHLILFDLADRKKIIKYSKQNKVELFRAWFTDMIRSVGVRCEMFGGSLGPDVVVNENGFVAYISVEGAFDDNPDISIDKMTGDLLDNNAAFRKFILPEDRDKKVFYAFLVKNEESFENRKTILKTIGKKTGNKHGCVINLQELLEVFNEAAAKGEEKNIGHIIEQLFNSKRQ